MSPRYRRSHRDARSPTRLQLGEQQFVGGVAVDLVGTHENEDGLRGVPPSRLEEVDDADRIDVEIVERNLSCFVVRQLRSAVDDKVERMRLEQCED